MIIDGKKIADEIADELSETIRSSGTMPILGVVHVGDNEVSERFVRMKEKFAERIGVETRVVRLPAHASVDEVARAVSETARATDAIIIQLPLPLHLKDDTQKILNHIPPEKDADVLSELAYKKFKNKKSHIMPPVAGAIQKILEHARVNPKDKKVVVVGKGKLVGTPVTEFFKQENAVVYTLDEHTKNISAYIRVADIIVSGAGVPGIITPDMISKNVVLIDAGTSEQDGKLKGDASSECADKAAIFTPVPGGVGPLTIASLFENLIHIAKTR